MRREQRLWIVAIAVLAWAGFGHIQVGAQTANLLQNANFESGFTAVGGDVTRTVANNWTAWFLPPDPNSSYVNATPQYRAADNKTRVHGGQGAQEYFTFYATHTGGIYQTAGTPLGSRVRFTAYVNVWSTNGDDPDHSYNPGGIKVQVGIDPTGGTDATASGIVWSAEQEFYDEYRALSIDTVATGASVTVFVRSSVAQPLKNNHVYVDDASLTVLALAATNTPLPSSTATPTNTATITATPTIVPSSTATPTVIVPTLTPVAAVTDTPFPTPTQEGTIPVSSTPGGATATFIPTSTISVGTVSVETLTPSNTSAPPTATNTPGGPTETDTPFVTATASSTPNFTGRLFYTVVYGDTVYDLTIRFNSTIDAIISLNGLNEEGLIFIGEVLTIPVTQFPTDTPVFSTATNAPPSFATRLPFVPPFGPTVLPPLVGPTLNGIGTYIVQAGETLFSIAHLYNTSPEALARLNGIVNVTQIRVGQVLVVPGAGNNANGKAPPPAIPKPRVTYIVQPGDNLYRISLRYNVTLDALMRANHIINANTIYVGQTLYIP